MHQPVLLCVGMNAARAMRINMIALRLGVRFRPVQKEEYGLPIETLCESEKPRAAKGPSVSAGEMLVMAYFPDQAVDAFLKALRESGMPPIPLKAVMTETNRRWSCAMLYSALLSEAAQFPAK